MTAAMVLEMKNRMMRKATKMTTTTKMMNQSTLHMERRS